VYFFKVPFNKFRYIFFLEIELLLRFNSDSIVALLSLEIVASSQESNSLEHREERR